MYWLELWRKSLENKNWNWIESDTQENGVEDREACRRVQFLSIMSSLVLFDFLLWRCIAFLNIFLKIKRYGFQKLFAHTQPSHKLGWAIRNSWHLSHLGLHKWKLHIVQPKQVFRFGGLIWTQFNMKVQCVIKSLTSWHFRNVIINYGQYGSSSQPTFQALLNLQGKTHMAHPPTPNPLLNEFDSFSSRPP